LIDDRAILQWMDNVNKKVSGRKRKEIMNKVLIIAEAGVNYNADL
jgi:hypothetical protein